MGPIPDSMSSFGEANAPGGDDHFMLGAISEQYALTEALTPTARWSSNRIRVTCVRGWTVSISLAMRSRNATAALQRWPSGVTFT